MARKTMYEIKSRNLMIGDWLYYDFAKKYVRVIGITDTCIKTKLGDLMPLLFKPVRLTPHSLRKNGFVYDSFYECYRYKDCELGIEIGKNGLYEGGYQDSFYMVYSCCFVHELQHALRLCGLTDLADNFKLK